MVGCNTGEQSQVKELESFVLVSNYAFCLLWRETAIVPDCEQTCPLLYIEGDAVSSKGVHSTKILEKIIQNKGQSVSQLLDMQKCERPVENCLQAISAFKYSSLSNILGFV